MKKVIISVSVLLIFALYAIRLHFRDENRVATIVANTPNPQPVTTDQTVATPGPQARRNAPSGATPPKQTGRYKNGTYIGDVADAYDGNIQVQVVVSSGQISDVQFLQYPNDRQTSIEINTQAMPLLKQEAIQAQSAQVSGVSGASATSAAFIQSLQSALSKAV